MSNKDAANRNPRDYEGIETISIFTVLGAVMTCTITWKEFGPMIGVLSFAGVCVLYPVVAGVTGRLCAAVYEWGTSGSVLEPEVRRQIGAIWPIAVIPFCAFFCGLRHQPPGDLKPEKA